MEIDITFEIIWQVLNTLLLVGIIYSIVKLIIKLPKRIRKHGERIERIENILEEINRKLD